MRSMFSQYTVTGGEGSGGEYVALDCNRCQNDKYGIMAWSTDGYSFSPPAPTLSDLLAVAAQHEKEIHS